MGDLTPIQQMILTVISSSLATGGFFKLIEFLVTRRDKKKNKTDILKEEVEKISKELASITKEIDDLHEDGIVMMHDRIYQIFTHLQDFTEISTEDRVNIDYLFNRYTKRGGNHKAELMYNQIKKKPIVEKYNTRKEI